MYKVLCTSYQFSIRSSERINSNCFTRGQGSGVRGRREPDPRPLIPFPKNYALFSENLLNASKMYDQPVSETITVEESELTKVKTSLLRADKLSKFFPLKCFLRSDHNRDWGIEFWTMGRLKDGNNILRPY